MKVFSAAIAHESNSFSPLKTDLQSFSKDLLLLPSRGQQAEAQEVINRELSFADLCADRGHQYVQGPVAMCEPSAPMANEDFEFLLRELEMSLTAALPVDFVLLFLHGAQMTTTNFDCEGEIVGRVRRIVGPAVPLCVELDLHASITPAMLEAASVLLACKEYPHTDFGLRAVELFDLAEQSALGTISPQMSWQPVPMLGLFGTRQAPMRRLLDRSRQLEQRPEVLNVSLIHGFPWGDSPYTGAGVLVTVDAGRGDGPGDNGLGSNIATDLAAEFFSCRAEIATVGLSVDEAIGHAMRDHGGLTVIADVTDNSGGGAPSDSTHLLSALIKAGAKNAAVGMIWDPQSVLRALEAGVGATVRLEVGGKASPFSGPPVACVATVTCVQESLHLRGLGGMMHRLGPGAAIDVAGVKVVLSSERLQVYTTDCFTALDIDPTQCAKLVVKSAEHFRAGFDDIATSIVYCAPPGVMSMDFSTLPYRRLQRPIWPLDSVPFTRDGKEWT